MLTQRVTTLSNETIEMFRSSLLVKGRAEQTAKGYTADLRVLLTELESPEVQAEEYEQTGMNWLTANRNKVSPKTTGRRLTALKQFAAWAGWPYTFSDYSAPTPGRTEPHPLPEGIAGVKAMIDVAGNYRHKALIALCGLCGLRVAEALAVRPSNFNVETHMLTVRGKGDKTRRVPVSSLAWEVLTPALMDAYCSGLDSRLVGIKDRGARALISSIAERANLRRHVSSHDLRATFATEVYNRTRNQRVVQELLGHSSGVTTEGYIGVADAAMRDGVEL
jgi:site-specific recombinase XerD